MTGKVTSKADGSPIPGVNVVLKGSTSGTVTDSEGKYSLSVPGSGASLVFSFIGMKSEEVEVGERTVVDMPMAEDVTQLSEVVVTALGIEKTKNELGYAAQKIDGSQLSQTRDNNFINALSGKISGVDIKRNNSMGGSTNIVIRGIKNLAGSNQALFVVDGVPIDNSSTNGGTQAQGGGGYDFGNSAADINPDDIESVNVLKGAGASALYGTRASNGVIMITTKKGKKKNGVGFTANYGVNVGSFDKTTFPTYQKKFGGGYGAYYEDPTGFFLYRDNTFSAASAGAGPNLVVPTSEDASWGAPFDPSLNVYQWDAFEPTSKNFGKATPWVAAKNQADHMLQTTVQNNVSFLLDGQTDKGYYKVGYTRSSENGVMPNSSLNKDFFNFSASYKLSEKLTATASANVTNVDGKGRQGTGYDGASARNLMTTFREWYQVNVDNKDMADAYFRTKKNATWNYTDPSALAPIYWDNPYWTRYENYETDNRLRVYGYAMLNYKATKWMDIMGRASVDTYNEFQEERIALGSVGVAGYTRFNRNFIEKNYDVMANFHKDFGSDIKFTGLLGSNTRTTRIQSVFASTNGGLVVPHLYAINNSLNAPLAPTETFSELAIYGQFAGASVTWKKMLTLDGNIRRDQASSLPTSNNTYYYGSVSGSFVFSELVQQSWLTNGKLRVNYAQVGDQAAASSTKDVYDKPAPYGNVPLFSVSALKRNDALKPAITHSQEMGLEMSFLDARVGFDVTYYKASTINQILQIPVSRATGVDAKVINAGELQNQGWEFSLYADVVRTDNFSWRTTVNWTRNRNKVVTLAQGLDNYQLGAYQGGVSINAAIGKPFGEIRGNNFVYTNGQKTIRSVASPYYAFSATSNETIGNVQADWIGGINNKFTYKGITASFLIDVKQGGQLFNLDMYYGLATGLYPETAGLNEFGNSVRTAPGDFAGNKGGILVPGVMSDGSPNVTRYDATNFGIYGYRRNPSAAFIYNAGYVKLREVLISYSLPSTIVSKLGPVKGIDVSLVGRNLWIIQKHVPYADPEDNLGAQGLLANGYQVGTYPNMKNIGFNLKFKF